MRETVQIKKRMLGKGSLVLGLGEHSQSVAGRQALDFLEPVEDDLDMGWR